VRQRAEGLIYTGSGLSLSTLVVLELAGGNQPGNPVFKGIFAKHKIAAASPVTP